MKLNDIDPAGHRVLIRVDAIEKVSEGGIIIHAVDNKREQSAQVIGTLVKVGPNAWKDFSDGSPWAQAGDRVLYAKYGGYELEIDGAQHRLMNDEDVTAVVRA